MLRLARQRMGLRQTSAARLLGIRQNLLSRMENGLVDISDEFIDIAESIYELPNTFFYQSDKVQGAPLSIHPMWRRKADVTVKEMDMVVAELNIRAMHLRRLLEGIEIFNPNEIPRFDIDCYEDPEKIAELVRRYWKIPNGPISNLTTLVEGSGVIVCHSQMRGASISGVTFSAPGIPPIIMLNDDQPSDRMRYTLAHELGHLVMHQFPSSAMEKEANDFAAALLLPASDIQPYFNNRRIDLALLASMKPEWRTSMQALLMRATSLQCLSKNQAQYLWKQISALRIKLNEPPELDFPMEEPAVITKIIQEHIDSLGYSKSDLACILHIQEEDFTSMYPIDVPLPRRPRLTLLKREES